MTDPMVRREDLTIGGVPAVEWLHQHRRELVQRALAALRTREDPERDKNPQLRWIADYNIGLFMTVLGRPDWSLDETEAADLVASAALRASEGSPIEALLLDYIAGMAATWDVVAEGAREDEREHLREITRAVFTYMSSVSALVIRGFQHEASRISIGERDARFSVYSALLTGAEPEQAALRAGIPLATRYVVLSLRLGTSTSDPTGGDAIHVAGHRRANTVQRVLAEQAHGDVLALVRDPVGTALVPVPDQHLDAVHQWTRGLLDALAAELGVPVTAGAAVAEPAQVPEAGRIAEEVLELTVAMNSKPGAWFLEDVLVPYQLTRPGPARELLAHRLAPLDNHPDWEQTLRTYLASGFDRRSTAETLHVHPNTVDYRLGRIADACQIDPTDPAARPAALAALCVRDMERAART